MKNLPIGVSTFSSIIRSNALYVDKTEHIYHLLKPNSRYFLSRPRRFGKSLTCSTLDAIFSGEKELFKGLWIGQSNYTWEKHPVIYIDFNEIDHETPSELVNGLHDMLNDHAEKYDITLGKENLKAKFAELIKKITKKYGPVVIIIDEYDKPILDLLNNPKQAELARTKLRSFYGTMKSKEVDKSIHLLFVTGVSKFSKVSLFSELNNLSDITLEKGAAALVGYTDKEVDFYLHDHIQELAKERKEDYKTTRELIRTWYNGIRFTKAEVTIYNPFSLHNCLTKKDISNYWFTSGTPNFLIEWVKHNPLIAEEIETVDCSKISGSEMESFTLEMYYQQFKVLLLQTGYLSITGYNEVSNNYTVGYPNYEIRNSMSDQIMTYIGKIAPTSYGDFIPQFKNALLMNNIELFCQLLQKFLLLVPNTVIVDREKFYQGAFYMICLLANGKPLGEVATHVGFIDIKLETNKYIYIIEFKKGKTPDIALKQIESKGYARASRIEHKNKPIMLVGISFIKKTNGVDIKWKIKQA